MPKFRVISFLMLSFIIALLSSTLLVFAQDDVTGVNILFVIDQSGSMGGERFGSFPANGDGNDELDLRFAASQYAVDWLGTLHQSFVSTNQPEINMAVLYFGTDTQQWLDWTEIDTDVPTWETDLSNLIAELDESTFPRNLVDTDFANAFTTIGNTFFRNLPLAGGNSYNAVVIITDGGPCTRTDSRYQFRDPNNSENIRYTCDVTRASPDVSTAMQQRIAELDTQIDRTFPADVFEYYVIGLDVNATSDPANAFWPIVEDGWRAIACDTRTTDTCAERVQRITTSAQMGTQVSLLLGNIIQNISDEQLNSFSAIPGQGFFVPPYQQSMRIDIFKNDENPVLDTDNISLLRPDGNNQPTNLIYNQPLVQSVYIQDPASGNWDINFSGTPTDRISGVIVTTYGAGVRAEPIDDAELFITQPITVRLVDGNGTDLATQPSIPITMEARLYDARPVDRDTRPQLGDAIPLIQVGDTPVFTGNWTPLVQGEYEVRVTATYIDPETGNPVTFIPSQTVIESVAVAEADILWEQVFEPSTVRQDEALTVEAQVVNGDSRTPLANTGVLAMQVTYTDITDPSIVYEKTLTNEVGNDGSGTFLVTDILDVPGTYTAVATIGIPDATGVIPDQNVLETAPAREVTIQPLIPLSVVVTQPNVAEQTLPVFSLSPFRFQWRVPLVFQVQIRSDDGSSVSLNAATGSAEASPTVTFQRGNNVTNITDSLQELQPGIYTAQIENVGYGTFDVSATTSTPSNELAGTYVWEQQNDSASVVRGISWLFLAFVGGLLLILLALGIILYYIAKRQAENSKAPLTGSLTLMRAPHDDPDNWIPVQSINFNGKRNVYKSNQLTKPFKSIIVTTEGNEKAAERGTVYIKKMTFTDAEPFEGRRELRPDAEDEFSASIIYAKKIATSEDGQWLYGVSRSASISDYSVDADPLSNLRKNN